MNEERAASAEELFHDGCQRARRYFWDCMKRPPRRSRWRRLPCNVTR